MRCVEKFYYFCRIARADRVRGWAMTLWKRRLLDALVLTLWNFANFKLFVKNKATVDATGYVIYP